MEAAAATLVNSAHMATNVTGSVADTPNNSPSMKRVTPRATPTPATVPIRVGISPCLNTSQETSRRPAPSAMRRPISRIRRLSE